MKSEGERPPGSGVILGILIFGIVTTIAYWVVWFGVDRDILASAHTPEYYAFENSFPLADGWMVATGIAATWGLVRRRAASFFWCIASGAIKGFAPVAQKAEEIRYSRNAEFTDTVAAEYLARGLTAEKIGAKLKVSAPRQFLNLFQPAR